MNLTLKAATSIVAMVISMTAGASAQTSDRLPPADDVVTKMMQFDAQRQSGLTGYVATRH